MRLWMMMESLLRLCRHLPNALHARVVHSTTQTIACGCAVLLYGTDIDRFGLCLEPLDHLIVGRGVFGCH